MTSKRKLYREDEKLFFLHSYYQSGRKVEVVAAVTTVRRCSGNNLDNSANSASIKFTIQAGKALCAGSLLQRPD